MALASDRVGQDCRDTQFVNSVARADNACYGFCSQRQAPACTHSMGYFARPVLCGIHALCGCFDNSLSELCHAERANANLCDK
jgi:hypothetical protein